jgi:AraC family transcriptional regulator
MNDKDVRIVRLEPLRVARFHGFGATPEDIAWKKLAAWAEPRGLLDYTDSHRIFGFNNPNPGPGSPNYGYEFWITVTEQETAGESVEIVNYLGGLYAVATAICREPWGDVIGATWRNLVAWREQSRYRGNHHQWLEHHVHVGEPGHDFDLDLYMPIAE